MKIPYFYFHFALKKLKNLDDIMSEIFYGIFSDLISVRPIICKEVFSAIWASEKISFHEWGAKLVETDNKYLFI